MDDLRIGAVIRALRLRLGLTPAELAIKAGVSPAMISRLEHGRFETTDIRTLRRVFAALDADRPHTALAGRRAGPAPLMNAWHASARPVFVR